MNCIYIRKRIKKKQNYFYCTLKKCEVSFSCYQDCDNKKYKEHKAIRKRTYKQSKKEKERSSIIYQDLTKCCVKGCITPYCQVEKNEVFEGAFRNRSIKYGAVCPFCKNHHDLFHNDSAFNLKYKIFFQQKLVEKYSLEWFIKTFGQDYNVKYNKIVLNKKSSNYIK